MGGGVERWRERGREKESQLSVRQAEQVVTKQAHPDAPACSVCVCVLLQGVVSGSINSTGEHRPISKAQNVSEICHLP